MHSCCTPGDYDKVFSPKQAAWEARRYRRRGLTGRARAVAEEVKARGVRGRSILEIGGGIGAIQLELLRAGAASATNVELASAYEIEARRLIDTSGVADRVNRRVADFVTEAAHVPVADVVIMHQVVCCYPDASALVGAAASHARQLLVMTIPVDRPWMRIGGALINLWPRLRGSRYRFFVHPTRTVLAAANEDGMTLVERHGALVFQLLVFAREDLPA